MNLIIFMEMQDRFYAVLDTDVLVSALINTPVNFDSI